MNTLSLDHASQHFDEIVASVLADAEPTVVTTPSGESVVVVPLDDYRGWQETAYLLRSPANAEHLQRSIAEAEAGLARPRSLAN